MRKQMHNQSRGSELVGEFGRGTRAPGHSWDESHNPRRGSSCGILHPGSPVRTLTSGWRLDFTMIRGAVWFQYLFSVQYLSHVQLFATPWAVALQASQSISNPWSLLKLMSIDSVMPCNHLILLPPLLLLSSNFPSIRIFSNESAFCIRWSKYWSFSFSISPSNEYSGLISFRMDWLALLAVQGTLKSLLQHHSSEASNSSALSFLYNPTLTSIHDYWKTIALTRQTFVGKVMSLVFFFLTNLNLFVYLFIFCNFFGNTLWHVGP